MQNIGNDLTADYYLANDIDCSCTSGWNGGAGFEPIGKYGSEFTGTFDGKGYKITYLYINRPSTSFVGLFGFTYSGSEIKDVGLEEVDVRGDKKVGGLVGENWGGPITNSYSSGSVSGNSEVGGLVGYLEEGTITNSYWDIYRSGRSNCVGSGSSSGCAGKNSGNSEPNYWYYSTHAPMDNWDFDNIWGILEGVAYPYLQWQVSVPLQPNITSFAPPSPVSDTVCNWRTFNVTVDQTVNVSWYLNNTLQQTNVSTKEASYTLHAVVVGEHNVSAIASNANGSDMQTWVWNILQPTDLPDLVIADKWEKGKTDRYKVFFVVENIGTATAPRGHYATLYVDGEEKENLLVRMDLKPGKSYRGTFRTKVKLTGDSDTIMVRADNDNVVEEADETNNCLENVWP